MRRIPIILALFMTGCWSTIIIAGVFFPPGFFPGAGNPYIIAVTSPLPFLLILLDLIIRSLERDRPFRIGLDDNVMSSIRGIMSSPCVHCTGKGLCNCAACTAEGPPSDDAHGDRDSRGRMMRDRRYGPKLHRCSCCAGTGKFSATTFTQKFDVANCEIDDISEQTVALHKSRIESEIDLLHARRETEIALMEKTMELKKMAASLPSPPFSLKRFFFGGD